MYNKCIKRLFDILISLAVLTLLSPIFLILCIVGAVAMKGNPFYLQKRPGKGEKIFTIIKFRTMTNELSDDGELLPDEERLTKYGRFLRAVSIDELPEFINILKGDMSLVGPRPLLIKYLPLYSERHRHRHDVRPGLTGLAQINGRNLVSWNDKFEYDIEYVEKLSFPLDFKIFFCTFGVVFKRGGVHSADSSTSEEYQGPDKENSKELQP